MLKVIKSIELKLWVSSFKKPRFKLAFKIIKFVQFPGVLRHTVPEHGSRMPETPPTIGSGSDFGDG